VGGYNEHKNNRLVNGNGIGNELLVHSPRPIKTIVVNTEVIEGADVEVKPEDLDSGSSLPSLAYRQREASDDTTAVDMGLPPNGVGGHADHEKMAARLEA
jgi:hypothetical protein